MLPPPSRPVRRRWFPVRRTLKRSQLISGIPPHLRPHWRACHSEVCVTAPAGPCPRLRLGVPNLGPSALRDQQHSAAAHARAPAPALTAGRRADNNPVGVGVSNALWASGEATGGCARGGCGVGGTPPSPQPCSCCSRGRTSKGRV